MSKNKKLAILAFTLVIAFASALFAGARSTLFVGATLVFADAPDIGEGYITDIAGMFSDSQMDRLGRLADRIVADYECEARVVIVDSLGRLGSRSAEQANNKYYSDNNLGYGADRSCVILLVSVGDREMDLGYWGFADYALTEYGAATLVDKYIVPHLSNNQYYEASEAFLVNVVDFFDKAKAGKPFDRNNDPEVMRKALMTKLGVSAVISLLIALLVCFMWKSQMKSAKLARTANQYIPAGGFNLTGRQDLFLYRTVTRRKIERSTSSGGGSGMGSSRSGGGGHTSRNF